jgi:hypothetical protein
MIESEIKALLLGLHLVDLSTLKLEHTELDSSLGGCPRTDSVVD